MQIEDIRIMKEEFFEVLGLNKPEHLYAYLCEDGSLMLNGDITATKQYKVPPQLKLGACVHQKSDDGIISWEQTYTPLDNNNINRLGYTNFSIYFSSLAKYCKKIDNNTVYITIYPAFE